MDVIEQGVGELFMDPDADKARAAFRQKSRKWENKVMSVKEAVERFVHDGEYLALGGFGCNRIPAAAAHEIVRQGKKNMGFAGNTSTIDFEILCAGEVFNRCDVAYVIALEARGLSPMARRYMESGKVKICEWTNYSLAVRFKAASAGVSFYPARDMMGTDSFKYSAAKMIECPFSKTNYVLLPALYPDVAVIHVHEADIYGNCRIRGITMSDYDIARASKRVIITCERLISTDEIRNSPNETIIPFWCVDAVCEVPYGSYPGNMAGEYYSDELHIKEWLKVEKEGGKDPEVLKKFLDEQIFNCKDHFEYIQKNGGMAKMQALRQKELLLNGAK